MLKLEIILSVIIIILLILILVKIEKNLIVRKREREKQVYKSYNYQQVEEIESKRDYESKYIRKGLLSKKELIFYKSLNVISEKLNLVVLSKVRLADLIKIQNYKDNSEYYRLFGRIKSKHIDFALASREDLEVKLIIELDDYTHNTKKAIESDKFKNEILQNTGYKLLRVRNSDELENKIQNILNRKSEE